MFACLVFYFLWPALTYKGTTHGLWSGLGGYVFACLVLSFFLALYGHWEGYDSDGIHSLARIDDNDLDTP